MRPALFRRLLGLGLCLGLLGGCSSAVHYPVNPGLEKLQLGEGYRGERMIRRSEDGKLMVILTFSGGGSRAAALAYGVLEELARHPVRWNGQTRRLIDEVDLVAGVSGGSITATYWALAGDRIFTEFEPRFLQKDLQTRLIDRATSFSNVWRITSPRFGRGDLLAEELDEALFEGATFGDLARRRSGPFVVISATDLASGARFDFTQESFDLICSDLNRFPLARAVAASSAVPFVFSPITLWNRAGQCGENPVMRRILDSTDFAAVAEARISQRLKDMARYADVAQRPYIHLVDGGVADNLALRGLVELDALSRLDAGRQITDQIFGAVERALIIAVDAGADNSTTISQSADVPKLGQVAEALADTLIQRYSDETRYLIRETFGHWRTQALDAGAPADDLPLHIVQVSLQHVADPDERKALLAIPTTLYLPPAQTQALRAVAGRLIRESADFQRLLRELDTRENTGWLTAREDRPGARLETTAEAPEAAETTPAARD